jgi:dodecin
MMEESVYPVTELVGSSPTSWEDAAKNAIEAASKFLWNLRIAEVKELDVRMEDEGKVIAYRTRLKISFKYDNWKTELGWKIPRGNPSSPSE